jgi:hypothetical protein
MVKINDFVEYKETDRYIVGLRPDGILHVLYKDNVEITVDLQHELNTIFKAFCMNGPKLFIFQAGINCSINKSARDNAIAMQDQVPAIAYVVFAQNMVYKMIANFYYKFNKPKQPFNVVTDFNSGIYWLLNLNQTNSQ